MSTVQDGTGGGNKATLLELKVLSKMKDIASFETVTEAVGYLIYTIYC